MGSHLKSKPRFPKAKRPLKKIYAMRLLSVLHFTSSETGISTLTTA